MTRGIITVQDLRKVADNGNVDVRYTHNSICKIGFVVNGIMYAAQFDDASEGVYAFSVENPEKLFLPAEEEAES